MRKILFLLTVFCTGALAAQAPSPLKPRQPHWRPKIVEHFGDGLPKRVLFYEQIDRENEAPVKELAYFPNGQLKREMDLTTVKEGTVGYEQWKSEIVPHGGSVTFFAGGQVEKVAFYDEGIVHGKVSVYYPEGKVRGIASFDHGKRHGNALTYYQDGKKAEEVTYEQDQIVGDLVRYYPNEERAAMIPY